MKNKYVKVILEDAGIKVNKKLTVTDTSDYQHKRTQIISEINADKVKIDYEVFKKNTLEKIALKKAKKEYLLTVNTAKYEEEAVKTRNYIAKNPLDCGDLTLIIQK